MFSVYDAKAGAYLRPFFADTVGLALRVFGDAVAEEGQPFALHPEDYTLFHLGQFDQVEGGVVGEAPRALATALSLKASRDNLRVVGGVQ